MNHSADLFLFLHIQLYLLNQSLVPKMVMAVMKNIDETVRITRDTDPTTVVKHLYRSHDCSDSVLMLIIIVGNHGYCRITIIIVAFLSSSSERLILASVLTINTFNLVW